MSKSKLFYEIVSEVLPTVRREDGREGLETNKEVKLADISNSPVVSVGNSDNFQAIYPIKPNYKPPNDWKEVEKDIWYTAITGHCAVCGKGTYYRTFIPESVSLCSRTCHERFKL